MVELEVKRVEMKMKRTELELYKYEYMKIIYVNCG